MTTKLQYKTTSINTSETTFPAPLPSHRCLPLRMSTVVAFTIVMYCTLVSYSMLKWGGFFNLCEQSLLLTCSFCRKSFYLPHREQKRLREKCWGSHYVCVSLRGRGADSRHTKIIVFFTSQIQFFCLFFCFIILMLKKAIQKTLVSNFTVSKRMHNYLSNFGEHRWLCRKH